MCSFIDLFDHHFALHSCFLSQALSSGPRQCSFEAAVFLLIAVRGLNAPVEPALRLQCVFIGQGLAGDFVRLVIRMEGLDT